MKGAEVPVVSLLHSFKIMKWKITFYLFFLFIYLFLSMKHLNFFNFHYLFWKLSIWNFEIIWFPTFLTLFLTLYKKKKLFNLSKILDFNIFNREKSHCIMEPFHLLIIVKIIIKHNNLLGVERVLLNIIKLKEINDNT